MALLPQLLSLTIIMMMPITGSHACLTPNKGCVRCDNLLMAYDLTGLKNANGSVNYEKFKDVGGNVIANGSVHVSFALLQCL